jgi:hypothetical protein
MDNIIQDFVKIDIDGLLNIPYGNLNQYKEGYFKEI